MSSNSPNSFISFFFFYSTLTLLLIATRAHPDQPDTPVTRFQNYLRIKTAHPHPDYVAAVSYLKSQGNSIGLQSRTFHFAPSKPLLLLTWPGSDPTLPSLLLNSHLDSVPAEPSKWAHPPFSAHLTPDGHIFARGAQDDKCIAIQYLEAIRNLKASHFHPIRTVHVSYVPDEEIGGLDGSAKFAVSEEFKELNVGFVLDEGQANPGDEMRVFYADRTPWNLIVKAKGMPGHGSRMFDNSAMENLMKSVEVMTRFREAQFDEVKAGNAATSEVISVNPVYMKAGIVSGDGYAMNMQPSEAEAGFNIRIPPTVDPELVRQRIAEEWAPEARNLTYQKKADFARFRKKGIHPDFEEKLDRMFKGTSATGKHAYAPGASLPLPRSPKAWDNEEDLEESGDSDETLEPKSGKSKRKRSDAVEKGVGTKHGRVGGAALLAKKIDRMCEAIESRSTATSSINKSVGASDGTSIKEVMKDVSSLPGVGKGSPMFFFASRLFIQQEKREMYCCMDDPNMKLEWLKFEMTEK